MITEVLDEDGLVILEHSSDEWAFAVPCEYAADADDDGEVTTLDATVLLRYVFREGSPLPDSRPGEPGADPSADSLGCATEA